MLRAWRWLLNYFFFLFLCKGFHVVKWFYFWEGYCEAICWQKGLDFNFIIYPTFKLEKKALEQTNKIGFLLLHLIKSVYVLFCGECSHSTNTFWRVERSNSLGKTLYFNIYFYTLCNFHSTLAHFELFSFLNYSIFEVNKGDTVFCFVFYLINNRFVILFLTNIYLPLRPVHIVHHWDQPIRARIFSKDISIQSI